MPSNVMLSESRRLDRAALRLRRSEADSKIRGLDTVIKIFNLQFAKMKNFNNNHWRDFIRDTKRFDAVMEALTADAKDVKKQADRLCPLVNPPVRSGTNRRQGAPATRR